MAICALLATLLVTTGPVQAAAVTAPETAPDTAHHDRPAGIPWFEGGVAEAFAAAGAAHKPVFLYWGAIWCPPCQELKATVLRRQDFRDRLSLFVPVYLDGDEPGAQAWGERFHVTGYPTVLVLRADQVELERVSGGMELARYAEVLDLALGQVRPAEELLQATVSSAATLAPADCRQLAYNDWQSADAWVLHPEALGPAADALAQAAQQCPKALRLERARLQVLAASAAVLAQQKAIEAGLPIDARLGAQLAPVAALLAERPLAQSAGDALERLPAAYFKAAARADAAHRTQLRERYFAVMDALSSDRRYSDADHLYALYAKMVAARALDPTGKVPVALAGPVRRRIDAALAREKDPYVRSSLINAALNVLEVLGDDERAHEILAAEVATSPYAYYYMTDLADIEEKRGHTDAAIALFARSYATAQGPATRFQWGVGYVRALLRLRPQDDAGIRAATLSVLADLDAAGDLHGRTRRGLARLDAALRDWNQDASHAATLAAARERLQPLCARIATDDPAHEACGHFLAPGA